MSAKGRPGEVRQYTKNQLVRAPIPQRVSPHEPALVEALLFAEVSGRCPKDVLLVGIVPESSELGCGLTKSVRAAVVPAISAILSELHKLGVEAKARARAAKPSICWEEKASSEFSEEEYEDVSGHSG